MTEILALLQSLTPIVAATPLRQMSRVIHGMLISNGRLTMLEISRWTEAGGSYRTIQRLYHTPLLWLQIQWNFFTRQIHHAQREYIATGDEVVFGKAGKETYGLSRFFSSLQNQTIPGLAFFTFALIDVTERRSYPIQTVQTLKSGAEKTKPGGKLAPRAGKHGIGRPKGSKNKRGEKPMLSAELLRIQPVLQAFLAVLKGVLAVRVLVMDGHFGNYPSAWMVLQSGLHFVSKLRSDAALYEPYTGTHTVPGPRPKYARRVDVTRMEQKYLKSDLKQDGLQTQIYQAVLLNKVFAFPLNVVVVLKTNLRTRQQAYIILFSTDLELSHEKIVDYYTLRFQIEFNFRDAKQYWGLDDFMNIKKQAVTNAVNLSFFMANFSSVLLRRHRKYNPEFSVGDLKAHYRGCRYASETIKLLPQKPDPVLLASIFDHIARLGMLHPPFQPTSSP
jgi:putative transposase